MNIRRTPGTVAAPFGPYSHPVEVPEGSRLLYISGEVGVLPDGTVPKASKHKPRLAGATPPQF
jgi:2-iminobutanoate/2-iminopropanoate deaminase